MRKIYADEITALFKEKGVNEICECCGKDDWGVISNFAGLVSQAVGDGENQLFRFPVVALECENCGNMRFFSRRKLGIKENPEGKEES